MIPKLIKTDNTIYDLLEKIEKRPAMFVKDESLQELSSMIWGYYEALRVHNVIENVPKMDRHFGDWLHYQTGWSSCAGWANEIEQAVGEDESPIELFFFFVEEYRKLKPTLKSRIKLNDLHNPTGKMITIGGYGLLEKPKAIKIMQYTPKPLHYLRFHYLDRIEDFDLLMRSLGDYETSVKTAKFWAKEEFQIKIDEWQDI